MMSLIDRGGRPMGQAPEQRPASDRDEARSSWGFVEGDEISAGLSALRLLGGGERYEAYLSWDDELLSLVVVKILRPSLTGDARARYAIEAEAAMLERLRHPVIVRVFDAVLEGERPHLVLEHVEGPRLSTLVRTFAVALEQTLSLGLQLSSAAHYMSARDVVHLDIKPPNVIMAGPARLIDLSLARRTTDLAAVSSPIGTTKFMAPEQCDPARFHELAPAADVWGIGVTLYWTLAGGSPFADPAHDENAALEQRYPQLVQEPAPLPANAPPDLSELILAMLSRTPGHRPTAREALEGFERQIAALPRPRLGRLRVSSTKSRRT